MNEQQKTEKPRITPPSDEDRAIGDKINEQVRLYGVKVHPCTAPDGRHMLIAECGTSRKNWIRAVPFEVGDIVDDVRRWLDCRSGGEGRWPVATSDDDFI
jgi:hypothetical protein